MAENPTPQPPSPTRSTTTPPAAPPSDGQTTASGGGDLSSIAEDMERTRAAQDAGTYQELVAEVAPPAQPEAAPEMDLANAQVVLPASGELPAVLRPAAMADTPPPPGLTPRGWSIEVTARHPELMAQALEELAARGDISPQGSDPVDPTDGPALRAALSQLGNIETLKTNLRNRAAELNGERLGAAVDKVASAGEAVKLALSEVIEEAKAAADQLREQATAAKAAHDERRAAREAKK